MTMLWLGHHHVPRDLSAAIIAASNDEERTELSLRIMDSLRDQGVSCGPEVALTIIAEAKEAAATKPIIRARLNGDKATDQVPRPAHLISLPAENQAPTGLVSSLPAEQDCRPAILTSLPADADHFTIAKAFIGTLKASHGAAPVYTLGSIYVFQSGLWVPRTVDSVAAEIGATYGGMRLCRRGSDFGQIARLVTAQTASDGFFEGAPPGVATPAGFWRVTDKGEIVRESLNADHRQRMRMQADPEFDAEAPLFDSLLSQSLGDTPQKALLQVAAGGALTRTLWRQKVAILLLGQSNTGKSTLLQIIRAPFPPDMVGATSPQKWGSEYYVAALAGKVLNLVGELDPHEPIPGGAFKNVIGAGDTIEGRHPTHRPFTFTPMAAHFFNANRLPPTVDRSDAFFNRWRILTFENSVADEHIDPELVDKIIGREMGPVLAWMLNGAARLGKERALPVTDQHRSALLRWRVSNNSALQFLLDPDACRIDCELEIGGQELFEAYTRWASAAGIRAFGRHGFYQAIVEGGSRVGVMLIETPRPVRVLGVCLAGKVYA